MREDVRETERARERESQRERARERGRKKAKDRERKTQRDRDRERGRDRERQNRVRHGAPGGLQGAVDEQIVSHECGINMPPPVVDAHQTRTPPHGLPAPFATIRDPGSEEGVYLRLMDWCVTQL